MDEIGTRMQLVVEVVVGRARGRGIITSVANRTRKGGTHTFSPTSPSSPLVIGWRQVIITLGSSDEDHTSGGAL